MATATPTAAAPPLTPLEGVRVLDLTRVLAGPYATMALAELGADVVKVETPDGGDETRAWGPPFVDESSAYFHAVNRGKRSVVLDLRSEQGRADVQRLAATCDVVVENFRPGVTRRLGVDEETLRAVNPRLVYVSVTGFGSVGPMAETAGTEVVVEAESGLMSITGLQDGEPVRFGVAMVDIATGLSAVGGVLAALLERERTGRGRTIEVSLFGTALSVLGTVIAGDAASGPDAPAPRPWGSAHPSIVPYRAFPARDGHLVVGAINDPMWRRLWAALDRPEVAERPAWIGNAARVADRDAVEAEVAGAIAGLTVAEAVERLSEHGVLVAPVNSVGDAARSPQARALGQVVEDGDVTYARSPLHASGTRRLGRAPALGAHTDEVLAGLDAPVPSTGA
ncbi:CaiB/BaiF CoA transferase family protein [Patulibacter sp. S7RM1-6]